MRRLSYSNVMATVAVFIALGGGAYAVTIAPKNSVKSKSIKDGQVKTQDLHNHAVTSAKLSSTAIAPDATTSVSNAGATNACPATTGVFCGVVTSNEHWANFDVAYHLSKAGFYKDREGTVHLSGVVTAADGSPQTIFLLPTADRPGLEKVFTVTGAVDTGVGSEKALRVDVLADGEVQVVNTDLALHTITYISLDGITFRVGQD